MADVLQRIADALGGQTATDYQAQTGQEMAPGILDYVKRVLSGDVAASGMPQNRYDPTQSPAQNARNPLALEDAINVALGVGPGAIRAYHGSPHNFDRFDISKIGTGEGNQAFTHGLYFGGHEGTARGYRDQLSSMTGGHNTYQGQRINPSLVKQLTQSDDPAVREFFTQYGPMLNNKDFTARLDNHMRDLQGQADRFSNRAAETREGYASGRLLQSTYSPEQFDEKANALVSYLDKLRGIRGNIEYVPPKTTGHMYEVDIHADPSALIDLDKPLAGQSPGVLASLERGGAAGSELSNTNDSAAYVLRKAERSPLAAADLFNRGGDALPLSPQEVSQRLRTAGIPGARYLDRFSRGAGEGSSNYVTYSDDIVDILRKYGLAGATGGAGALAASNPYGQK